MNLPTIFALTFGLTVVLNIVHADGDDSTSPDLQIYVLHKPDECDIKSKKGSFLSIHYKGTFTNGKQFDSSYDKGQPFSFQIGVGQALEALDQGLLDMCIGEKRRLIVPPNLGYGEKGAGNVIPPHSTVQFEIELLKINDKKKNNQSQPNVFKAVDTNDDSKLSRDEVSDYIKKQKASREIDENKSNEEVQKALRDHDELIEKIFRREDQDKNGFITHDEFSGPKHDEL